MTQYEPSTEIDPMSPSEPFIDHDPRDVPRDGFVDVPFDEGAMPSYVTTLNDRQQEAVLALDGPVLVLAGAGTGKTRVLTTRLGHLMLARRVPPGRILAVTFTNKAAREMRDRVGQMIGHVSEGWWLGTFHALAARILRQHAELVGLRPSFSILDTDDQLRLLKQVLEAEGLDAKRNPTRVALGIIDRWKDRGLAPDKLKAHDGGDFGDGKMVAVYAAYQERLKTLNACDFGDLLLHNLTLLQTEPEVLARWQRKFQYILVDEYQDTNIAQYLWLRLLAQGHKNLCCVGDDDQSIYGWRGAEVGNILRFDADFSGAVVVRLEQNYRSTGHILAAASAVIAHNAGRLGKTLWTADEEGEPVRVHAAWDGGEEARWIGDEIEAAQRSGTSLNAMAVLVRASFMMRGFEERFIQMGLPYRVVGGPRFYERLEIRDALAYLRLVAQPQDDLAFERIINTPKRGLGPATVQLIQRTGRGLGISLMEATARLVDSNELKPKPRTTLRGLLADFARWRGQLDALPHDELAGVVLDESGYTRMWQQDKSPEAQGRLDNLEEFVAGMREFDSLLGFLEHVALVMEAQTGPDGERVTLMTLHAAKGLEYDLVFLPGWEEGVFPHQRAMDESGIAGLEEERRLAYVGLTRARRRAVVTHAGSRLVHGQWLDGMPSRFIGEIPERHLEMSRDSGLGNMSEVNPFDVADGWRAGQGLAQGMASSIAGGASGSFGPGGNPAFARFMAARKSAEQAPARPGPVIDGKAYHVRDATGPARYGEGQRVSHSRFGEGTVIAVDGDKLEIEFDGGGRKKLIDSFVSPA